jgi:serine/threonine protein kinase
MVRICEIIEVEGIEYKISHMINEGGSSKIYVIEDTSTKIKYILKVMMIYREDLDEDHWKSDLKVGKSVEMTELKDFENEVRIHRRLSDCPHIISFKGSKLDKEFAYIIVEYFHCDIREHLLGQERNATPFELFKISYQLFSALSYMHSNDVVHLDLAYNNILFHKNEIKIIDFGISKFENNKVASIPHNGINELKYNQSIDISSIVFKIFAFIFIFDQFDHGFMLLDF